MLVLASSFVLSQWGSAKPLEPDDLRHVQKVGIYPGTFDPVTLGHLSVVENALAAGLDAVIVLPASKPLHKTPLDFGIRIKLWDLMAKDHPKILVPSQGVFREIEENRGVSGREFHQHLLALNPSIKTYMLAGPDVLRKRRTQLIWQRAFQPSGWFVALRPQFHWPMPKFLLGLPIQIINDDDKGYSSSEARRQLKENFQLYFSSREAQTESCPRSLDVRVCHEIYGRGLYIGKEVETKLTLLQSLHKKLARAVVLTLERTGQFHWYKRYLIRGRLKNAPSEEPTPHELGFNTPVKLTKLESGMSATAYRMELEGQSDSLVVKIPHGQERYRRAMVRTIETSLWLKHKRILPIADLVDYDPDGRWALYKYVQGPSLETVLRLSTGRLGETSEMNARRMASLRKMYEQVHVLSSESGIYLDFAPDNIVFSGDEAVLIDLGQIGFPPSKISFDDLMKRWLSVYSCEAPLAG